METTTEVENGFKETEIGLIPKEWDVKKIGDIITLSQYGLSMKGEKSGQYPILRMKNLEDGRVSTDDLQYVSVEENIFNKFKLNKNDILFNRTNSIDLVGKTSIFYLDMNTVFASYLIRLATKREINPHFLNFYLNWHQSQVRLKGLATRAVGQSNISATRLKTFLVPIPSYVEQGRISSILFNIQNTIEQQDKIIETTENLKKSLMQKLFTEGIGHTEFKDSEIGEVPKGWDIIKLEELATKFYGGGTPSTSKKDYWNGKIPWMTSAFITDIYVRVGQRYITKKGLENSSTNLIPKNNILIGTRVGTGKVTINLVDMAISQDLTGVVVDKNKVIPEYLAFTLLSPRVQEQINRKNRGVTIKGITREDLKACILPVAPLPEQAEISHSLHVLDNKIEIEERRKAILQQLFKTILNKLMTGEIRVNNLDIGVYDAN